MNTNTREGLDYEKYHIDVCTEFRFLYQRTRISDGWKPHPLPLSSAILCLSEINCHRDVDDSEVHLARPTTNNFSERVVPRFGYKCMRSTCGGWKLYAGSIIVTITNVARKVHTVTSRLPSSWSAKSRVTVKCLRSVGLRRPTVGRFFP